MDFTLSEHQQAIADLADKILGERCPPQVLADLEQTGPDLAAEAWRALAAADLLGLGLPSTVGGSGLGMLEACLVAEQVGRHVALVPHWPSTLAAAVIAQWGSEAQARRWLPGVIDGSTPLTVALWEPGAPGMAVPPTVAATPDGDGWRLDGEKQPVPWAAQSRAVIVPARAGEDRVGLFAIEPGAPGVTVVPEVPVSQEPHHTVVFDAAPVTPDAVVVPPGGAGTGASALVWAVERATALLCATALGVVEEALALTACHASQRQQFGAPIGTFQAVAHRCADAYIDTEAIRLTTWQAVWRLDAGLPATDALAVAAFWVADGGQRVVHAAQHLHGGIGVDTSYPVHRYFRWAKVLELLVGGASAALLRLGSSLAGARPATS